MKLLSVVGARPNFIKIAPFIRTIARHNEDILLGRRAQSAGHREIIDHILVHTGQHYDDRMSKQFFNDLEIPQADINLEIGSGTHAEQVGQTMIAFEKVLKAERPDWVVVVGDVNATLACSVTAKKENIKCCHIEAGLRSGDMTMPEEINRLVTDRLSDLLLAPDRFSVNNLKAEGVPDSRIRFVGNIMIDTLESNRIKASLLDINKIIEQNWYNEASGVRQPGVERQALSAEANSDHYSLLAKGAAKADVRQPDSDNYCIVTIHRPSNVDTEETLSSLTDFLIAEVTQRLPIIWPLHPRTVRNLKDFGLFEKLVANPGIILLDPVGYLEMLRLNMSAKIMLTDSGGLQEECTVLGTPFITLRKNTERPVTLSENGGVGVLAGNNSDLIRNEFNLAMEKPRNPVRPELWDGHAAERCLRAILEFGG
jgi:UDP-N-acetylglucosamine 2-epimerase (non-hydrolysing)